MRYIPSIRPTRHFGYVASAWQPFLLGSSVLSAWWNADDHNQSSLMTDDGAGLISSFKDRAGQMAVTAATTARPTWASNSFNSSYAGLTFDGVANCLVSTTLTTIPTGATAGWAMALASPVTLATGTSILNYGLGAATSRNLNKQGGGNDAPQLSDGSTGLNGTPATFLGPHMLYGDWSGTAMNGYLDGTFITGSPATIASLNTSTTRLRLGATAATTAASFFVGVMRHVFVGAGVLTTAQRQLLEGWMAWDANLTSLLPASHPYKSVRP